MLSVVPGAHNRPRGSRGIGADRAGSDRMVKLPGCILDWTGLGWAKWSLGPRANLSPRANPGPVARF